MCINVLETRQSQDFAAKLAMQCSQVDKKQTDLEKELKIMISLFSTNIDKCFL